MHGISSASPFMGSILHAAVFHSVVVLGFTVSQVIQSVLKYLQVNSIPLIQLTLLHTMTPYQVNFPFSWEILFCTLEAYTQCSKMVFSTSTFYASKKQDFCLK